MRVLVTGGAGFIGSSLVKELLKKNEVVVLDDLSNGKRENIPKKIEFIKGSITNRGIVEKAVEGCEYIFHEAAQISVEESIKHPRKTWDVNIRGTRIVLDSALRGGVKKVVLASSAAVYGNNQNIPLKESEEIKPISFYGETKKMNELDAGKYYEQGLRTTCLRYFNVYGPGQDEDSPYSGVISKFIGSTLKGKRPVVYGDGEQTRDFVFVKDVVKANLLAMERGDGKIYNIGTGKGISVNELVKVIDKVTGKKIKAEYKEEKKGDIRHSVADVKKAKEELGFEAEYSIEKGIRETIEWFKKN
ncbi:NAD-dependent epimerase/dehydratase family protein [Candidatus Micrarchaeota archaeon]|nr:NAD-dependent epimerase/dehydratase family protein [Candidatus Micrarchaeota archaeon]